MSKIKGFYLIVICFLSTFSSVAKDVYVKGYDKKDGTYVAPHYRSSPNSTVNDNWSTYGNINPHTGEVGSKRVYDQNHRLPTTLLQQSSYIPNEKGGSRNPVDSPVSQQEQTNTFNFFWHTLALCFLFTIFLAPLIDRWISTTFSQRQHYASLFSLKSFVVVYVFVPFILNVSLHFYLISN